MPSFGEGLKREREKRGITLDDISISTKIGTRLLHAIEEDHFEQLPGGIFNKGFVRAYARCVGLDEDETVAEFMKAAGESTRPFIAEPIIEPVRDKVAPPRANSAGAHWQMFAGLLLLAAVGFAGLHYYSQRDRQTASQPEASSESTMTNPAKPVVPAATSAVAVPATGKFTVLIKAREDCWLSVTADGKEVFADTLAGPGEKSIAADKNMVIKAGNVGALDLFFDGKKVPVQGDYGEVKTLAFDSSGLRPTPQAASVAGPP